MKKQSNPWRNRIAVVACAFAAFGALTTVKAMAAPPAASISNTHGNEGQAGSHLMGYTIKLSAPSANQEWVKVGTMGIGAFPAVAGEDYNAMSATVFFAPGVVERVVYVNVLGDTKDEWNETVAVNITAHSAGITVADNQGIGTIVNDDVAPALSINDVTRLEGTGSNTAFSFTVKLSAPSGKPVSVSSVGQSGSAHIPDDLVAGPVTLNFHAGSTVMNRVAWVTGDALPEGDELFTMQLSNPSNATIVDAVGVGRILNDDHNAQPPADPQPQPQPQPQPPADNGGGVVVGGGGVPASIGNGAASTASDNGVAAGGEQALSPAVLGTPDGSGHRFDWTTGLLFGLLGMCLAGLVAVAFLGRRRHDPPSDHAA